MTAEQAIKILEQATANLQMTRADHATVAEALRVLRAVVTPHLGDGETLKGGV